MHTLSVNSSPVIAGVEITIDAEGRFNLNALHKAHLAQHPELHKNSKQPADWLKLEQAKVLIQTLSNSEDLLNYSANSEDSYCGLVASAAGRYGGTFAHELLAISYAGWISPTFQLQVNQTFIDYRTGKFSKPDVTAITRKDLAYMLIESEEENERLRLENSQLKPDVDALHRIAKSDGGMCITNAAKELQKRPKALFVYLQSYQWIYRRAGGKSWLAYQEKIQSGYLEHKVTVLTHSDGTERTVEQVLVTPKGLVKLSQLFTHSMA